MPKGDDSFNLRRRFAENLQRMMDERGYTPRETAKKAGIKDVKRFYRWATVGITRASFENDVDLEKLRDLFQLQSVGQFWKSKRSTLAERILAAGEIEWEYAFAYKLLVALRSKGKLQSEAICTAINELFGEVTQHVSAEMILQPKTAVHIMSFVRINHAAAYVGLLKLVDEDEDELKRLTDEALRAGLENDELLNTIISRGLEHEVDNS